MSKPNIEKPTKTKLYEAQSQIENLAISLEEKPPIIQAIHREILKTEIKLANLRALEQSFLKTSLDVVENTRNDLKALLDD